MSTMPWTLRQLHQIRDIGSFTAAQWTRLALECLNAVRSLELRSGERPPESAELRDARLALGSLYSRKLETG